MIDKKVLTFKLYARKYLSHLIFEVDMIKVKIYNLVPNIVER